MQIALKHTGRCLSSLRRELFIKTIQVKNRISHTGQNTSLSLCSQTKLWEKKHSGALLVEVQIDSTPVGNSLFTCTQISRHTYVYKVNHW